MMAICRMSNKDPRHTDRYHCLYALILLFRASSIVLEDTASCASRDGIIVIVLFNSYTGRADVELVAGCMM